MDIIEFKNKKYGDKLVNYKELVREFNKNEKDKKRYFYLKNNNKTGTFEFINIKSKIIW